MCALNDASGGDERIAALAEAQHGVVTRAQLLGAGLSARQVGHRLDRRRLHALYRGVYAVGHTRLGRSGRLLAAAWSAGPRGSLCDVAAASVHDLRRSNAARIDVILPQRAAWHGQAGIRAHASHTLRREDCMTVDGIPVTTIARTVVDLAAHHPPRLVERVLDEMVALEVYDQRSLDEQLGRLYVRGTRALAAILASHTPGTTVTRSELEELLLTLCDRFGLPRPQTNTWLAGREVDAHWPGTQLVVELDSARFHSSRTAFERDREKGNALVSAGYVLVRLTWRQLTLDPGRTATDLTRLLARANG